MSSKLTGQKRQRGDHVRQKQRLKLCHHSQGGHRRWKRQDSVLEPKRGYGPPDALVLDIGPPELCEYISVVWSHVVCVYFLCPPWETNTVLLSSLDPLGSFSTRSQSDLWEIKIWWPLVLKILQSFLIARFLSFFFFLGFYVFVLFFWAALGLCCCLGFFLVAASGDCSWLQCSGFSLWWPLLLQSAGSSVPGLQLHGHVQPSGSSWTLGHRLSSYGAQTLVACSMWGLPRPGIEPVSPPLAGGFQQLDHQGSSYNVYF